MATFDISLPGEITCYENVSNPIAVGDAIRVIMDTSKYPGITQTGIDLVINTITPGQVYDPATNSIVAGAVYNVTVPDSLMPANLTDIDLCDILSWSCRGCCEEIRDELGLDGAAGPAGVKSVGVVADLQLLLSPVNGDLYQTQGYYAVGDSGGNLYRYYAGSTDVCDGGAVFDGPGGDNSLLATQVTYPGLSVEGRFIAVNRRAFIPEQFGANLGAVGHSFRVLALSASLNWDTHHLNQEDSGDPTTAHFPVDKQAGIYRDTDDGRIYHVVNNTDVIYRSEIGGINVVKVFDPGLLADGMGETTTMTAVGAVLGDHVQASFSLDLQGVMLNGWVSAADTISVRFQNETGAGIDLGSGTIKARASKG